MQKNLPNLDLRVASGVARITLGRPERLNSLNAAMHADLVSALDIVEADRDIRCVLLTGEGRAFCAGQDLGERRGGNDGQPVDLGASLARFYNPLIRRLTALPVPTLCAVNGVAAGAGVSLALACDLVLASRSARFIQSFAKLGLIPDSGGSWILPRLVGQARALGLALLGDPIDAATAADWGMIWRVVDDEELMPEADALADRLARAPTLGLVATKMLVRAAGTCTLDEALDRERDDMKRLGESRDYREGVDAFLAKRPPKFEGR